MSHWSLNAKIILIIGILVIGNIATSVLGLIQMGSINDDLIEITDVRVKNLGVSRKLKELFYVQIINERNFLVNPQTRAQNIELIHQRHEEIKEALKIKQDTVSKEGLGYVQEFIQVYDRWREINSQVIQLYNEGKFTEGTDLITSKGREIRISGEQSITKLVDYEIHAMNEMRAQAEETYQKAKMLLSLFATIACISSLILAFYVMRITSKAIHNVITALNQNSQQMSQAAQQIATASEGLSTASTEQASSLEETVATLEELTSMVHLNSNNAKEAANLANQTKHIAEQGEAVIQNLVSSMGEISKDSKKIEEITSVVDDIAFQTNLLALNAAVEAARAGEQGKGFAVVAEAVRNLAQRSSNAAKDIAELIKGSVHKINTGSHQATQSGEVLGNIVASVNKVSSLNTEISTASTEQSNGIQQISKAMNQLDQVTQVNAATSEETSASAQELSAQSDQLLKAVKVLIETIDGKKAA